MDEKFKDIIQRKVYGFEVEPDAEDWSVIEQKLAKVNSGKKRISITRYISAAAVAALFVVSGFAFYLTQKQDNLVVEGQNNNDKIVTEPVKKEAIEVDTINVAVPYNKSIQESDIPVSNTNKGKVKVVKQKVSEENIDTEDKLTKNLFDNNDLTAAIVTDSTNDGETQNPLDVNNVAEGGALDNETGNKPDDVTQEETFTLRDNLDNDFIEENKKKNETFAVGLLFGSNQQSDNNIKYEHNEIKQLSAANYGIVNMEHDFPVSLGLSVRKNLNRHFALETGLTYTFLRSKAKQTQTEIKQTMHYIGIPLTGVVTVKKIGSLSVYLSAGGMVEKNIAGNYTVKYKVRDNNESCITTNRLQWSANAHVGLNWNIYKKLGLYAEPGWVYYFDDKSNIETYRSKNPSTFNLQIGFRFGF